MFIVVDKTARQVWNTVVVHHAKSCLTRCDPMDCSLPGSSLHGILQARTLEWVAISFSRDLLDPGIEPESPVSPALQAGSLPSEPSGTQTRLGWLILIAKRKLYYCYTLRAR